MPPMMQSTLRSNGGRLLIGKTVQRVDYTGVSIVNSTLRRQDTNRDSDL